MRTGAPCTAAASDAPADSLKSTSPAWSARTPVVPGACRKVAVKPSSRSKPSAEATCIGSIVIAGTGNTKRTSPKAGRLGGDAVVGSAALAEVSVRPVAAGGGPPGEQATSQSTVRMPTSGRQLFIKD